MYICYNYTVFQFDGTRTCNGFFFTLVWCPSGSQSTARPTVSRWMTAVLGGPKHAGRYFRNRLYGFRLYFFLLWKQNLSVTRFSAPFKCAMAGAEVADKSRIPFLFVCFCLRGPVMARGRVFLRGSCACACIEKNVFQFCPLLLLLK